jgi:hypothetical protein
MGGAVFPHRFNFTQGKFGEGSRDPIPGFLNQPSLDDDQWLFIFLEILKINEVDQNAFHIHSRVCRIAFGKFFAWKGCQDINSSWGIT